MNRVAVNAGGIPLPEWSKSVSQFAQKVLTELGRDKWELSVLLCDDATITELNSQYRGKAQATDVLSFSLSEGRRFPPVHNRSSNRFPAGDIVISLDTLSKNARRYKINEDEELRRLLIHGILHLDGMDHREGGEDEPMLQLQEQILTKLADERILESKA